MPSTYQKGAETVDTSTQSRNTREYFSKHYHTRVEVVLRDLQNIDRQQSQTFWSIV